MKNNTCYEIARQFMREKFCQLLRYQFNQILFVWTTVYYQSKKLNLYVACQARRVSVERILLQAVSRNKIS